MKSDQQVASKLYELLYNGANIYKAPLKRSDDDAVRRFTDIVRELKQYMKED